jgi:putative oxidoreductase
MPGNSYRDFLNGILNSSAATGVLLLVARIFMAAVFVIFGIYKIVRNARMKGYMTAHGVPTVLIYPVILLQVGGGILVALGYQTRFAALILAGFCIIAPSLFHAEFKNPAELAHFTKDFAIAGGFLFMLVHGPGPLSLDEYFARAAASTTRVQRHTEESSGVIQSKDAMPWKVIDCEMPVNEKSSTRRERIAEVEDFFTSKTDYCERSGERRLRSRVSVRIEVHRNGEV